MCEYCMHEWYKRNTYDLRGPTNKHCEVHLSLDGEEGLLIKAEWVDEHTFEKYGLAAEAIIRYCPWCGRKLENKEFEKCLP